MGRIIKYDKTKTNTSRILSTVISTGGYPTNTGGIVNEQSATLWGNDFHGFEDLTGSMLVQGDITIDWDDDDYDDSLYDEEEGDEIPTGSLYVKNKVEANSVYGKSIFLDYPETVDDESNKTNLLDLIKDLYSKLNSIQNSIPVVNIYGSDIQPIVLIAGKIKGLTGTDYIFEGSKMDCIDLNSITIKDGLMNVAIKKTNNFSDLRIVAVNVTQSISIDTEDLNETDLTKDNKGSHWFEARPIYSGDGNNNIYIREFHLRSGEDDGWRSNDWTVGNSDGGVYEIDFVAFGYATPKN